MSLTTTTFALLQESLAVGAVKLGLAGHSSLASAPAALIEGGVVSLTSIVWLTFAEELPQASTDLKSIRLEYLPPQLSDAISLLTKTFALLHESVAVGAEKLGLAGHSSFAS